jgi:hypothetical protein
MEHVMKMPDIENRWDSVEVEQLILERIRETSRLKQI